MPSFTATVHGPAISFIERHPRSFSNPGKLCTSVAHLLPCRETLKCLPCGIDFFLPIEALFEQRAIELALPEDRPERSRLKIFVHRNGYRDRSVFYWFLHHAMTSLLPKSRKATSWVRGTSRLIFNQSAFRAFSEDCWKLHAAARGRSACPSFP